MNQSAQTDDNPWLKRWLIGFSSMIGFMVLFLAFSRHRAVPVTRPQCETDGGYVFVGDGNYIKGSSEEEREYAYQISAQMMAASTTDLDNNIQQLKKQSKFNQENTSGLATLPPFCIQRNLVTNTEYQGFIQSTGYAEPSLTEQAYQSQGFSTASYETIKPYLWRNRQFPPNKGNYPVVLISQKDAIAYARWKSQQDGYTYRLPSADEWEKAARGRNGRYFPWGNLWEPNLAGWQSFQTFPLDEYPFKSSPFRVENLVGTVLQLTSTTEFKGTHTTVVLKGCVWSDLPGACRVAAQRFRPNHLKHITHGFRLVREGDRASQ